MTNHTRKENPVEDSIVETLLRLPAKNLETRIRQLEDEIRDRKRLRDEFLSTMGTQQLSLEERAWQLRYSGFTDRGLEHLGAIESEIRRLGQMKVTEQIFSLRDVALIREKLMTAQEELEQELVKLQLVGSENGEGTLTNDNNDQYGRRLLRNNQKV
jgi:hypothetical protein